MHVYMPMGHLNVLALGNNINCRALSSSQGAAMGRPQATLERPASAAGTLGKQAALVSCMKLRARLRRSAIHMSPFWAYHPYWATM